MNAVTRVILLAQEHAPEAGGEATRLVLPELDELIFGAIAFFALLALLSKVAFPALRKGLQQREQAIRSELERAEQARLESEQKREEYERQLADARNEADRIIREAGEAAEAIRRERVARAEEEAHQIIDKARQDAGQEKHRAFADLQRMVADISIEAATRVLNQELSDPNAQRQLVEQFIVEAGARGNGKGG
jgi:F-type H+-transporting ATPase subunit b